MYGSVCNETLTKLRSMFNVHCRPTLIHPRRAHIPNKLHAYIHFGYVTAFHQINFIVGSLLDDVSTRWIIIMR